MIRITNDEFKAMSPGYDRVLIRPDEDDFMDATGIRVQRNSQEKETGTIIAVSLDAENAGWNVGDRIAYSRTSGMEVFETIVEGKDGPVSMRLRALFWQDISIRF